MYISNRVKNVNWQYFHYVCDERSSLHVLVIFQQATAMQYPLFIFGDSKFSRLALSHIAYVLIKISCGSEHTYTVCSCVRTVSFQWKRVKKERQAIANAEAVSVRVCAIPVEKSEIVMSERV